MSINTSTEAQAIMQAFSRTTGYSPVWAQGMVKHASGLSAKATTAALAELVAAGLLKSVKEDWTVTKANLLYGVHGTRSNATYYMKPERYADLAAQRDARVRKPFMEKAKQIVLERHAAELMVEFETLWAEAQKEA